MTEIIGSEVICKQPGRYIGWPTIDRTVDGELLVVFSGDREAHVCPFGKTFFMRSRDNGYSWSEPRIINNTPLDDRDGGILACSDGTLIASWFTAHSYKDRSGGGRPEWAAHVAAISADDIAKWAPNDPDCGDGVVRGHWITRSTDNGETWTPVNVPPTAPHGPVELSDGRLMFVGNDGYNREAKTSLVIAAESIDKGLSWNVVGHMPMFVEALGEEKRDVVGYLAEPHVIEVGPGRLLVMARYEEKPYAEGRPQSVLWQSNSDDGGHTWTEPAPTEILGKPPHLTMMKDGRILVTYGYRHEPYGERACFSNDGGATWDYANEVVLRDDAPNGDLGYPASVECDDGTILTVYYQVDQPGEKTCLMTTRWKG